METVVCYWHYNEKQQSIRLIAQQHGPVDSEMIGQKKRSRVVL
jgi:hypothetical protein